MLHQNTHTILNAETNEKLNDLVQYLQDSRNGYEECAAKVESPVMRTLFNGLSDKRRNMIAELGLEVGGQEAILEKDGTFLGKAHQYFVVLKSALTGGDVDAIITEVKRGENTTIDAYKDVLHDDLPEDKRIVLNKQLLEVEKDIAAIDETSGNLVNAT